ncbi:copper resistance protein NlpE N-terminal domain-containing protein [Pontibacter mangrovi]|uniref:Copper resistance protein NlpE n=1 Tax=Pontibacter mangrovi TaxID=2589816 RepID=A0A501WH82_9BACT|nr:copper resistance protein NlpE N-terminal domain-containing protein [Pontibacter mangrovi]TPE46407.1 copper resistance protein NlpE [Pontibacter mangrovi]
MKALLALFILFSLTFGAQQTLAQSGKSYKEWIKENRRGSKTASAKAPAKGKATAAKPGTKAVAMAPPSGTFRGVLHCPDCKGTRTELVLTGSPKDPSRAFTIKLFHVGKPAEKSTVTGSGKWFLAKGNKQDPNAVVLQLIPTNGDLDLMYLQQVSEGELRLLNNRQEDIGGSGNYSLRKL